MTLSFSKFSFSNATPQQRYVVMALCIVGLLLAPLLLQNVGLAWVRIVDLALLYVLLAVGLNIVVGEAGLLDLGYIAFYAVGAYTYALLNSPHLSEHMAWAQQLGPEGMRAPMGVALIVAACLAAGVGVILGFPTLKLRGDYLAIVTLGFGEIIRVFMTNMDQPINLTNGPKGIDNIAPLQVLGLNLGQPLHVAGMEIPSVTLHYYLFLIVVALSVWVCTRLQRSPLGRAWQAIREDETAAKAMGLNTRNLKLLAFAIGATFGGLSGVLFAGFQGFISPESFSLQESIMIVAMVVLGGVGHIPGVILGAFTLAALPEVLRYVGGELQSMTGGRLDAAILRQLLIALAMIGIMLWRPKGVWPKPTQRAAQEGVA